MIYKVKHFFKVKENSSNCSAVAIGFLGPVVKHCVSAPWWLRIWEQLHIGLGRTHPELQALCNRQLRTPLQLLIDME